MSSSFPTTTMPPKIHPNSKTTQYLLSYECVNLLILWCVAVALCWWPSCLEVKTGPFANERGGIPMPGVVTVIWIPWSKTLEKKGLNTFSFPLSMKASHPLPSLINPAGSPCLPHWWQKRQRQWPFNATTRIFHILFCYPSPSCLFQTLHYIFLTTLCYSVLL